MSSRVNNYDNDLNYSSAKHADMDDDFEDYNEGENLDDDDFVEGDYTDVDAIKRDEKAEEKFSSDLLFLIQEIGSMKKSVDGQEHYIPGPTCEKAIKDLVKYIHVDRPEEQLFKFYLGKWNVMRKDLIPLVLHQSKNKKLIYHVLTILDYLTMQPEKTDGVHYEEHLLYLESYKEQLSDTDFVDALVNILGQVVNVEEKTKYHEQMIAMTISTVRNLLQIQTLSKNMVDTYKESLQMKLYMNFAKSGGMFDAIIFLCQDMQAGYNKPLKLTYLEIFYVVLSSFPATFLFGSNAEEEYFKKLREREKFNKLKRQSELSTRHSRFGAMFEVKRKIGGSSAITGSVNFRSEDLLKLDKQRRKPKPNIKFAAKIDPQVLGIQVIDENFGVLNEEERKLQTHLKHFVADFLEHAYESVIDSAYDMLGKFESGATQDDFMHYFVVLAFGIECYCLEFERATSGSPFDALISRPITEQTMNCKFSMVIHGIQMTLIDLLYKTLRDEVAKKKADFKIKVYHACLLYFRQILSATTILNRSSYPNDQKNAAMLKQILFSKEFAKILKIGLQYYEPKIHGRRYGESLVKTQDAFFTLLAGHAKDKILSVTTDKLVKKAARRAKRDSGPANAQPETLDRGESQQEDIEDIEEEDVHDDREYEFKERKYNYFSEFSSFVDYPTTQKIIDLIRGERLVWNNKKVNSAVHNFIHRVMHDLRGEWIFFQTDFLQLFHEIISNSLVNYNKEHAATVGLIRSIVSQFFAALHLNPLLSVESLIRFDSHHTKEAILNNYEIPKVTEGAQDQEDGGFERQVIPWSKEEDMILVENYDFFREDKDPFTCLANLLRDQAFFRDVRDVKLRCKLLKVDASIDIARQLVEKTHTKKLSVETVATRVLLFTFAKGRDLESQLISFLKDIGDRYALHESIYPVAMNLQYPVLPTEDWEFEILNWPVIGSTMEYLGCERPTIGKVWWRASGGSQATKNKINELHQEIVRLGRMSERQLLDMAEGQDDAEGFRRAPRIEKKAIENKDRKSNNVSRKQASRDEKRRQIEEQNKINRELAGLASDDDEQLDLADFDDDDESSDQLDYGRKAPQTDDEDEEMAPKRRKVVNRESIGNQQASEDRPVLDLRAELREATNNGHSTPSKDTDNNGGKKPKRLKKANQGQAEEGSEPQGTDNMNTESAV